MQISDFESKGDENNIQEPLLYLEQQDENRNVVEVVDDLYTNSRTDEIRGITKFAFRSIFRSLFPDLWEKYKRD